jgi:hypothetical protein
MPLTFSKLSTGTETLRVPARRIFFTVVAILMCISVGPEIGIGLEMFALVELLGAEFFVFSFLVAVRALPVWSLFSRLKKRLTKYNSYYFIPSRSQIANYPAILAHVLPGALSLQLLLLLVVASLLIK